MGKTVSYKRPDGKDVSGYLAEPAGGKGPGVVVIQEWWGLTDQIKGVADKLAGAGYRALVPDLYRGKSTLDAKEAEHLMTGLNFGDVYTKPKVGEAMAWIAARSRPGDVVVKVPVRLHDEIVDTGDVLSWRYHAPEALPVIELKALDAASAADRLERHVHGHENYFLAVTETPQNQELVRRLLEDSPPGYRQAESRVFESRLRGFTVSVYRFASARSAPMAMDGNS